MHDGLCMKRDYGLVGIATDIELNLTVDQAEDLAARVSSSLSKLVKPLCLNKSQRGKEQIVFQTTTFCSVNTTYHMAWSGAMGAAMVLSCAIARRSLPAHDYNYHFRP